MTTTDIIYMYRPNKFWSEKLNWGFSINNLKKKNIYVHEPKAFKTFRK